MTTKSQTAPSSGKKRKIVNVHLLNGDEHLVTVDVKSKFQEVFNQVASHLCLRETEYFGLAFKKDNEYHFIVLDEKIHKLAPKQWKSGPGEGTDSQGKALINLWFRVQFYVDQVILLREKVTRHQYYLQLKENVLNYNHLYSEEKCFQLAGYALQADHGNYVPEKHEGGYFNPALYFPKWVLERHGVDYLAENVPTIHKDLHNMTRNDAELRYIRNASMPPGAHNLHFYTVRKRKTDKEPNTWLAICAKGVEVHEDDAGYKNHISTFMWKDIGKLYFDKKKFEIRSVQSAGGRRFMYYTDCDVKSKYLLSICRSTHMFQMDIQPKLLEIQHLDNEDQKRYRESYVYSECGRDGKSQFPHSPSKSGSATGSSTNQRFSVISDASSNTTSGIVSDRMAVSFDDGDDHSREIMIDCPPRSAVTGTPNQIRGKFQSFGYKQSPGSSKTSPGLIPHSLELCKTDTISGSPQDLSSPSSSNGSWRARHSHTMPRGLVGASALPLPSPTTPTQDARPYSAIRRSIGRKDSFSKLLQGPLLMTSGDKNNSGDSAVSMSGLFGGSDKLAPLSLPQSELRGLSGSPGQTGSGVRGRSSGSSGYSLTPPLALSQLKKSTTGAPSPPTSLNFASGTGNDLSPRTTPSGTASLGRHVDAGEGSEHYKSHINHNYKSLGSPRDIGDKLASLTSPRANIPEHYPKPLSSPRDGKEQQQQQQQQRYKPASSPQETSSGKVYKPLGSPRDGPSLPLGSPRDPVSLPLSSPRDKTFVPSGSQWEASDQLKLPSTPRGLHDISPSSPRGENSGYSYTIGIMGQMVTMDTTSGLDQQQSTLPDYHTAAAALQQDLSEKAEKAQHHHHLHQQQQQQHLLQQQQQQIQLQNQLLQQTAQYSQQQHLSLQQQHQMNLQHQQQQQQLSLQQQQKLNQQQQQQLSQQPQVMNQLQSQQQQQQQQPKHSHNSGQKSAVTEHYLLALQQGSSQLKEKQPTSPRGVGSSTPMLEKLASMQYAADLQQQQQQQQQQQPSSSKYHQYQTAEPQPKASNNQVSASVANEDEENNKENLEKSAEETSISMDEELKAQMETSGPRRGNSKGALHPELKHILGQSHAISLPLITALCNDSSLVQSSRSQSGSRSSYDTSTVRSTDSRLTRFSHDTDPRRWSSCGQGAGVPEVMMSVQSSRPYSWHSEHFELDSQLALPSTEHLPPTSPPNPRAVNNKHLAVVSSLLPQKMIESDPGPSSPRMKSSYPGTISWWDTPPNNLGSDPGSSSWAEAIPYCFPTNSQLAANAKHPSSNSLQLQHQQKPPRVPHKLSSGGHRDSDSSISHKQMMKENVGIA